MSIPDFKRKVSKRRATDHGQHSVNLIIQTYESLNEEYKEKLGELYPEVRETRKYREVSKRTHFKPRYIQSVLSEYKRGLLKYEDL